MAWRHQWHWQATQIAVLSKSLILALAWAIACFVGVSFLLIASRGETRRLALATILVLDAAVLFSPPLLAAVRPGTVDRPAIHFLKGHLGLSRFYTLDPIQPNYSAYFQTASIDYVSFPVPETFYQYLAKRLFPPLPRMASVGAFWPALYEPGSGLKYLCEYLPEYEALGVKYVATRTSGLESLAPESKLPTAEGGNEPLPLRAGQQIQFTVPVPAKPTYASQSIRGIAVFLGNYGNAADGSVDMRICASGTCTEASRPLSESVDNAFFYVSLPQPIGLSPGTPVSVILGHQGGSKPLALWIWPSLSQQDQHLVGPEGKRLPGKAVRVAFSYNIASGALPRVYHDSLLDIFELPYPAPYFSIKSGGPCRLDSSSRESMRTICDAPAVLIRRELYMPGWHASADSGRLQAKRYGDIFQSYDLPRGESHLHFAYVPPFATPAVYAGLFAAITLLAEFTLVFIRRWSQPTKDFL